MGMLPSSTLSSSSSSTTGLSSLRFPRRRTQVQMQPQQQLQKNENGYYILVSDNRSFFTERTPTALVSQNSFGTTQQHQQQQPQQPPAQRLNKKSLNPFPESVFSYT